jgi:hypothetical protein
MKNFFQILVVFTAVFGLGLGAAFGAGAWWGGREAPAATATPVAAPQAGGGGGLPAGLGGAGGAAQATTGVVEQIDGDTVTIRTPAGGTVAVKLGPDTQVRQLVSASTGEIKPGLNLIVQGQPDIDGKVAARSVQITEAPPGGGGQGTPAQGAPGQRAPGQR